MRGARGGGSQGGLGTAGAAANPPPPPGITNHDEYSLVREGMEEKKEEVTGTLRKDKTLLRDEKKMEKLKQKLHTDDEREQGAWRGRPRPRGRGAPLLRYSLSFLLQGTAYTLGLHLC